MCVTLVAVGSTMVTPAAAYGGPDTGVTVRTVPVVAGAQVKLDGEIVATNILGIARFPSADRRDAGTRLEVLSTTVVGPEGVRATLERTYGTGPDITLAYATERQSKFDFVTVQGTPVKPERIQSLTLKSSVGDVIEITRNVDNPIWLRSSRVVSSPNGPQVSLVQWSVIAVDVDGSNVVNRAEVRFEPNDITEIEVALLFFTARIQVKDAFFGFAQGGNLKISHPDGSVSSRPIPKSGKVVLADLPRGEYELVVEGHGVRLKRPLALSRDQDIQLELLSWLDLSAVLLVGAVFAVFPIVIGIRRRRRGHTELAVVAAGKGATARFVARERLADDDSEPVDRSEPADRSESDSDSASADDDALEPDSVSAEDGEPEDDSASAEPDDDMKPSSFLTRLIEQKVPAPDDDRSASADAQRQGGKSR